jgi:Ca2+/H+ antiporter
MRSIKSFIQAYKVNHTFRLFVNLLLAVIIIYILAIITTTKAHNSELNDLKRANKQTIKESERVIIEQQKEIDKLKKDVVLNTIIADSSIAKANRISKKTILNQIEYEKISTNVSAFDDSDIINFWASHKKR